MSKRVRRNAMILAVALAMATAGLASGYRVWNWAVRQRTTAQLPRVVSEETVLPQKPGIDAEEASGIRTDDARARQLAARQYWGPSSAQHSAQLLQIAKQEAIRWPNLMPKQRLLNAAPLPAGLEWINLGPTDANFEWNGNPYYQVDSGRPTGIAVDPTNSAVVYLATAGGGVWKTYQFGQTNPEWVPITETLGQLSVGAMDLDPEAPLTLHVGMGDFADQPGGTMVHTNNGGATWSTPVALTGTGPGGLPLSASTIRAVKVDPNDSNTIYAGTDVGLFVSHDGGNTYALIDLPNAGGTQVAEAIWSIVYTGKVNGSSSFAVSGVYACDASTPPPAAAFGQAAGATCTGGNPGDIWTTNNNGQSWTSAANAGTLPATGVGRIDLAAGTPSSGATQTAVIYAQLSAEDETNPHGVGYWRSMNSGATWADATGTLANPTQDCPDVNPNGQQSWYNQTISVDPANNDQVLVGGMLCGIRTLNGTSSSPSWENISDWLPVGGRAVTNAGTLPYVHADWHVSKIIRTSASPTGYWVLAGTDGGLFHSADLFKAGSPTDQTITWNFPNRGLVTHLGYSIGSGDPTRGNPNQALFGLQDNGTRFRVANPAQPTVFNQVMGGDGIGTAINTSTTGESVIWTSAEFSRAYCVANDGQGDVTDCSTLTPWNGTNDTGLAATCAGDANPFFIRYSPIQTDPSGTGVLATTNYGIFRAVGTNPQWTQLGGCFAPAVVRNIFASQTEDGVYGAALSGGRFAVSNCPMTAAAVAGPDGGVPDAPSCAWAPSKRVWVDINGNTTAEPNELLKSTSMIAFPPNSNGGATFVAASVATTADDGNPVDPKLGHIWLTTDKGQTWKAIHGNGTSDLPNIGVDSVRFDPSDTSGQTLYAGTELGVYRSTDLGQTWQRFGAGLPLAKVTELYVSLDGSLVRASTYGRGVWEINSGATSEKGVSGDGDFDRNLQLDFFDVGAMAARLNTNPSSPAQPMYDWNLDLVGTTNQIDDNDLQTLLSRVGGAP